MQSGAQPPQQISPAASAVAGDSGTTAEASQRETSDNTEMKNSDNTGACGGWKDECSQLCEECFRHIYQEVHGFPTSTLPARKNKAEKEQAEEREAEEQEAEEEEAEEEEPKEEEAEEEDDKHTVPGAESPGSEMVENSEVTGSPDIQEDAQRLSSQPDDEVEEGEDDSCGLPGPLLAMSLSDVVDESEAKGVEAAEAIHAALMKWEHARESQICWDEVKDLVVMEHTRLQTLSPSEQQKQLERLEFTSLEEMLECVQEWEGG